MPLARAVALDHRHLRRLPHEPTATLHVLFEPRDDGRPAPVGKGPQRFCAPGTRPLAAHPCPAIVGEAHPGTPSRRAAFCVMGGVPGGQPGACLGHRGTSTRPEAGGRQTRAEPCRWYGIDELRGGAVGQGGIRAARQGVWSFTTWGRTLKPREEAMDATSWELQR